MNTKSKEYETVLTLPYGKHWPSISEIETVSNLNFSSRYMGIARSCDGYNFCSEETNDFPVGESTFINPIAELVSGDGTQNILLNFKRTFPEGSNYTLYNNETCTNILTTFSSDIGEKTSNINLSSLSATNINYFWIKADDHSKCRRVDFAYK